jgi:hypothetical protein
MHPARLALRAALALCGAAIVFLGLNVGLGGIETLGWQGGGEFIAVTDAGAYAIRDSHIRFIGGVWLGVGLAFLAGALLFDRLRTALIVLCGLVFVGGLTRLAGGDAALVTSAAIMPSLVLELVLFPLLGLWIVKGR